MAASPFAASGSEALSPDHRPSVAPKGRRVLRRGGRRGPGSFRPAPGPASGARCFASRVRPPWQAGGEMVGWIQGLWSAQRLCPCADPRAILCRTVLWTARAHYPRGTSRVRMNSFRRPVLSSAIFYHCVSSAAPACGSSAHSSATLRAEKKRRLESARMLGATRRSGYPSDSSRRRRSQREAGLTATSTPATRRPHRPGPGSGIALPPGRCKLGRLPAVPTGPGRGATLSSRPDGASHR